MKPRSAGQLYVGRQGDGELSLTCWICGAAANSAEHRLKKSDLVRAHGRGPYMGLSALAHVRGQQETLIQGPGSKHIKYAPSLCAYCNNTRTQPFDRAYEQFITWALDQNEESILKKRFINFAEVFGSNWPNLQCDLYKYFAKSFGCRLIDAGITVPVDVVDLMGKDRFQTGLRLTLAVNEDILLMPHSDRNGFIGKSDLFGWSAPEETGTYDSFTWNEHVSWLTTCYWYNKVPDGSYGSTWVADCQYLYFGSFAPLDNESRLEFIEKVNSRHA
jgi:hypothetical protein